MYTIEEFDKAKTKILKYIMYKKRTEKEIKRKFEPAMEGELLEDVIENLKEIGYINDDNYIQRAVAEYMSLKNLSIKEISYKLYSKGLSNDIIDQYFSIHADELKEYELKSAKNLIYKKQGTMEENDIKQFLLKKGYCSDTIKNAFEEIEGI